MQYQRRNSGLLLLLLCLAAASRIGAQATTFGDQSPILRGVNNSVRYYNTERISGKIPDAVVPLLAGVLIVNKADPKSARFQEAISVWLETYTALDQKINALTDPQLKQKVRKFLAEGNFPEVEYLLQIKKTNKNLINYFPATYQTTGAQSPILVGDNSTVSYVVNKIIEYKLPESLTQNLLDRLYAQDKRINALSLRVADREQAMEAWIAQYQTLEVQLRNSPDSVNRKAWAYFHQGKLDSALLEISKAQTSAASLGRISFLTARIQTLQFDYSNYDSAYAEIYKNFQIASLLESKSPEIHFRYAMFVAEYSADNAKRIEILENAYKVISPDSLSLRIQVALQIAETYANLQRNLTAEQYLQAARQLILAEKNDSVRAGNLLLVHLAFSRIYGYSGQPNRALAHCDSALALAAAFPAVQMKNLRLWYTLRLNRLVSAQFNTPATLPAGLEAYAALLTELDTVLEKNVGNTLFLFDRYSFLANQYKQNGNIPAAKTLLLKNIELLRPIINPKAQLYFQFYFNNWLQLVEVLSTNADYAEWGAELHRMDTLLTQWTGVAADFSIQKSRLDFEYGVFFAAHKRCEEAIAYFQKGLDFLIKMLPTNPEDYAFHTAKCIENIGNCFAFLYKPEAGITYLQSQVTAINRIQSLDDRNYTFAKIKIYRQIGNLYLLNGRLDSARVMLETGLQEAEIRLTASNDAFLYDFISLSLDYANNFINTDNARALAVAGNVRSKIQHYTAINPYLRQKYLPDLAHTIAYTGHIYALSGDFIKADNAYSEALQLYGEMTQPTLTARYMFANFMLMYCDFLDSASYRFPKFSKKERADIQARKCRYAAQGLDQWRVLPDDYSKIDVLKRLNTFLSACR